MGRLMEALLVSFIDHGATPPSTLAARNTATTGAPLRACVAAGVLGFGRYHGGDIESLHAVSRQRARPRARGRESLREPRPSASSRSISRQPRGAAGIRPSISHAGSARRPAVPDGARARGRRVDHIQMIRAVDLVLHSHPDRSMAERRPSTSTARLRPSRGDLGHPPDHCRCPVHHLAGFRASRRTRDEEYASGSKPMRQIDPKDHIGTTARRHAGCRSGGSRSRRIGAGGTPELNCGFPSTGAWLSGRAPPSHGGGQWFESTSAHHSTRRQAPARSRQATRLRLARGSFECFRSRRTGYDPSFIWAISIRRICAYLASASVKPLR